MAVGAIKHGPSVRRLPIGVNLRSAAAGRGAELARRLLFAVTTKSNYNRLNLKPMNTDNDRDDAEKNSTESSILKQDERTDRNLFREFGFAALAGLAAFFSAVLTTVVEGNSAWRPFWLVVCIVCLLCAIALIVQGARNFGEKP